MFKHPNATWMDNNYDWNNEQFKARVDDSLNLAVNYVANVLHTLWLDAGEPIPEYSSILITVIVLGLSSPVMAQPPSPSIFFPTIYVDAPHSVGVSTEFDIIISIYYIPPYWGMVQIDLQVQWDPNDLEYIESEFLGSGRPGWSGDSSLTNPGLGGGIGNGDAWTEDAEWFRFRFHCLRSGPAPITVSSPLILHLFIAPGGSDEVEPEPVTVIVNQLGPVGGITVPVNKLEVLAPYIA
ncbi:MAG: hypothetical protein V3V84_02055, partial [Candidatus Bathyarchaeia archaeon]